MKLIWVTFAKVGFHCYPSAPEDVSYLRQQHRHLFKFKVTIQVFNNEREIEYHQFLNKIVGWYDEGILQFDNQSCETIASDLLLTVMAQYPGRYVEVEVSEDGECGSIVNSCNEE